MKAQEFDFLSDRLQRPTFWVATAFWVWISYATGEITNVNSLYAVYVILVDLVAGAVLSLLFDGVIDCLKNAAPNRESESTAVTLSRIQSWTVVANDRQSGIDGTPVERGFDACG